MNKLFGLCEIFIQATSLNLGLGMPPKWLSRSLAVFAATIILIAMFFGLKDPGHIKMSMKWQHKKYSKLLRRIYDEGKENRERSAERMKVLEAELDERIVEHYVKRASQLN